MELKLSILFLSLFGLVLSNPSPNFERDAEELAGLFEGDIQLTEEQRQMLFSPTRNGLMNLKYRWPDKTVPYYINESYFSQEQLDYIRESLDEMERVTCIKFVPRTDEKDYVLVNSEGSGCSSFVGRIGGDQSLNLQSNYAIEKGCFRKYTIIHEFLHALGFYHMQSAANRDEYVRIVWDKIEAGKEGNFNKRGYDTTTDFGVPYDYGSVLHYSRTGFSIDGSDTIVPIKNKTAVIGQRVEFSKSDILKVNRMYGCGMEPEPTEAPEIKPDIKDIIKESLGNFINSILNGIFGSKSSRS